MSKLNQIQNELKNINEARFQELCDSYLYLLGYEGIRPIGSGVGKEKTVKGTPDTVVVLPNRRFLFVQHTTQQTKLFDKLSGDLDECFDESKTGVPASKIEKIILCHNSRLSTAEEESLGEKCQKRGCLLDIVGIGTLSFALYQKFPNLAKEFLGVGVDTGQILRIDDFIKEYQRSAFATRLDVGFHFREEELGIAASALEAGNLLIISGRAGVGKSRFALECARRFVEERSSFQVFCIYNKTLPLYEDLKSYFSREGDYLILVDDANRLTQLEHVLRLLNDQRENHCIKIIITVRNYALKKVQDAVHDYLGKAEMALSEFKDDQIKELVSTEFAIKNHFFLDRINRIAKGNARLAVMAAQLAKETNRFESIADVSALYDEYFRTITKDLNELGNKNLLKAAGVVAFFKSLDRTSKEHFAKVSQSFNFSEDELWESAERLHEWEIVDLYEKEVVKISDQVLSTYLFYKVFFRDELLDFYILLRDYFESHSYKFGDAVYPVLETFDREFVISKLQRHVDKRWEEIKDDEPKLLKLMKVFWFLKKTNTLLYLKDRVDELDAHTLDISKLIFEPEKHQNISDHYLSVLEIFQHSGAAEFKIALEIIFAYLEKQPSLLSQVLYLFLEKFCFSVNSYDYSYVIQRTLMDSLIGRTAVEEKGNFYKKILLRIIGKYLNTRHTSYWMEGSRTIKRQEFRLATCSEIFQLRSSIWQFLIRAYSEDELRDAVLQIIMDYSTSLHEIPIEESANEIVKEDAKVVLPFLTSALDPSGYTDCLVAQKYFHFLEQHKVEVDLGEKARFVNETYCISKILVGDFYDWEDLDFDREESMRVKLISSYLAGYKFNDYVKLFESCEEIAKHGAGNSYEEQLPISINTVLVNLANADARLFRRVMRHLLQNGNRLRYAYLGALKKLWKGYANPRSAYNLLKEFDYFSKPFWLFTFLSQLPADKVNKFYLGELYQLYRTAELRQVPVDFDYLEAYMGLDKDVVVRVVEILYKRINLPQEIFSFHLLFNPNTKTFRRLRELFENNLSLLKAVYLYQCGEYRYPDYRGCALKTILEIDPGFIVEYFNCIQHHGHHSAQDGNRRYAALWELDNHQEIISAALECIYERENSEPRLFLGSYANVLFTHEGGESSPEDEPLAQRRMKTFISEYISHYYYDADRMSFIFDVITNSIPNERQHFLKLFLDHNKNYEVFKRLELEPSHWGGAGSMVPVLEGKIKFLESLLPLLSTSELLKHKLRVNEMILRWKDKVERESKSDFLENI
jgi:hypothetical protein